ncbi:MAG: ATP-binding protein [Vicinamibacteria bacterium]
MTRWLGSLRSRVFAATALVAVLPVALALAVVTRRAVQQAEAELARGLGESARLVQQYHRARLDLAAERATLLADLPKLKAAVAEADARTVEPVARDYRERVRADAFVVAGRDGRTLVSLGTTAAALATPFVADGGRLLETVSVPIQIGAEPPEVLGRLTLGFALDDDFAESLRALTGSHVAVAAAGRVYASTLGLPRGEAVDGEYATMRAPLGPDPGAPAVLLLRSRAEALRPLRTLRNALSLAAALAVAVSLGLSWAVARTVTRPLAALTRQMREIAETGDLARRLEPGQPWDDEDARLLTRTFASLTASIARFQAEAALRDRLSALGRLSTVIAHEVRNPLMIIKGSLRALRREGASPAELREAAADIDDEVRRLDRIVGDVLDFARPLRIDPAPADVAAIARDVGSSVLGEGEGILPRFALDDAPASVVTDAERLRAVLVILVENARDAVRARRAAAPASAADPIEIGARPRPGGGAALWVEDRGGGVRPQDLPHLFDPYFTTKRTGTGLGLAIARKIVEALGGSIRLDSREGEGVRAEVELPPAPPAPLSEAR